MAQSLDLKRLLATGRQLTETGRTQAVQLGTELVEQGLLVRRGAKRGAYYALAEGDNTGSAVS